MKSKTLALLGLLLMALPVVVQAQFTYTTNADNTLTITGYAGPPWDVTIPNTINGLPVVAITSSTFQGCANMTSLTIPGSITSIPSASGGFGSSPPFSGCASLTNITLLSGVTNIGVNAFGGCTNLISVTIPGSVISISGSVFAGFPRLYSVTIGYGITSIGSSAFEHDSSLADVTIPDSVTSIGNEAFGECSGLTNVTIGDSVTNLGQFAFFQSTNLISAYFTGNAPPVNGSGGVFYGDPTTVYYLPAATGWSNTYGDPFPSVPAVLWNPLIQANGTNFGVQNNQFGFNITGTNNFTVVVEACANLANPVWTPLQTVTLTNGSYYFSDPQWTNSPARFYGLGLP